MLLEISECRTVGGGMIAVIITSAGIVTDCLTQTGGAVQQTTNQRKTGAFDVSEYKRLARLLQLLQQSRQFKFSVDFFVDANQFALLFQ